MSLLFARGARGEIARTLEPVGGAGWIRVGRILAVAGICVTLCPRSIAVGIYELLLATSSTDDRRLPAVFEIGNSLREARERQGLGLSRDRARDEDPREVHPRARGGGLHVHSGRRVHPRLPAQLRRVPRARRRRLRRRVRLSLHHELARRAAPAAGAAQAPHGASGRSSGARSSSCSPGSRSWRFSSSRPSASRARRRTCRESAGKQKHHRQAASTPMLVLHGVGRGTYVEVRHNRASGKVDLQGTVGRGPDRPAPGQTASTSSCARRPASASRSTAARSPCRRCTTSASSSHRGGRLASAGERAPARASSSSPAASSSAASAPTGTALSSPPRR